jgi:restriction system protein
VVGNRTTYCRWLDVPPPLRTRTQWRREGLRVRDDAIPQAFFYSIYYRRRYPLFQLSDTDPTTRRSHVPGIALPFSDNSLAQAMQTINDAAKRRRDSASAFYQKGRHGRARLSKAEKEAFYELKDEVLQRLVSQGRARTTAYHLQELAFAPRAPRCFPLRSTPWSADLRDWEDDDEWSVDIDPTAAETPTAATETNASARLTTLEVIEFAGHTFHRPLETPPERVDFDKQITGLSPARALGRIRLRDALATLRTYLSQPRIVLPAQVISVRMPVPEGDLIAVIAVPWLAICRELEHNPRFLYQFVNHPRIFEEFIAASYERAGFPEVILTPRSGDRGRDVIATKPGHLSVRILDQCKAYSPNHVVSADEVRAMLGVVTGDRNTSKGVITTTACFAPELERDPILSPFLPHRIELRDGRRLREWLLRLAPSDILSL